MTVMVGGHVPPSPSLPTTLMNLKLLLPFQVFAEKAGVSRIVAETREGAFGLLPHRLDCVAALVPGILIYETDVEGECSGLNKASPRLDCMKARL